MPQNAVYKYFYKHVQKAMPFQTLALWPNFFMNFETENSLCLKLHLKKIFCRIKPFKVLLVSLF